MRRALFLVFTVALVAAPGLAVAQSEPAPEPSPQVVLVGDVDVARGEVAGEIVVFRGSAVIEGVAEGDVVVLRGPITVAGQVRGDVVALSGTVRLRETAQVAGSVIAGGTVNAEPGAQVAGGVTQGVRYTLGPSLTAVGALLAPIAMAVSVLGLGLLWLAFAPLSVESVARAGRAAPLGSAGWGILVSILLPAAAVVLLASVLALPLGIALLLALWLVGLLGLAATTWCIGRLVVPAPRSRIGAWFAGWAIAAAVGLVPFLNVAWWTIGSVFGVGAIVVAVRGSRRGTAPDGTSASRRGRHRAGRANAGPDGTLGADGADVPPAGLG